MSEARYKKFMKRYMLEIFKKNMLNVFNTVLENINK